MDLLGKKVDFWVLTIHIIRNTFSLVETGYKGIGTHPNFFGSSQAGLIDPKKMHNCAFFQSWGQKIELDREEDSLDERPLSLEYSRSNLVCFHSD